MGGPLKELDRLEESGNQALTILKSPGKLTPSFGAKNIDQQLRSAVISSPVAKNFPKIRRHGRNT